MTSSFLRVPLRDLLLCQVFLFPAVALAADDNNATTKKVPDRGATEVIIVTASRRAERLLRVPYDITAVSGKDIANQNIVQPNDLLRTIPGVSVVDRGPRNAGAVDGARIRGIGIDSAANGDYSLESVAPVASYINDTPVFANLLLKDIDRVEFLRGPQSTLYGSSSLGGTIRYLQNEPRTDAFSGSVTSTQSYTANSDGVLWNGDLTLNVPITDTLAVRGTITRLQDPGFIDYPNLYNLRANNFPPLLSGPTPTPAQYHRDNSANDTRTWYGRAAIAWTPEPDLKIVFSYNKQNDHVSGRQAYSDGNDGFGIPYTRYENGSVIKEPSARDINIESLEATYDLGFATLTSSSSYYYHEGQSAADNTGYTGRVYAAPPFNKVGFLYYSTYFAPKLLPYVIFQSSFTDRAWVEEVRLASNSSPDSLFDYVLGFFFQDQHRGATVSDTFPGVLETYEQNPFLGPGYVVSDNNFLYERLEHYQDRAGFGELTWHVTPRFSITGGLRYFGNNYDVTAFIGGSTLAKYVFPQIRMTNTAEAKPLGRANLSFSLDKDNLLYASFSQGYRRGGSNAVPTAGPLRENPYYLDYKSDHTNNYEFGGKGILRGLRYDVSLYWIDWSSIQLNTATPGFGYYAVVNGPAAVSRGLEAQLSGHIVPSVGFNVGYSYTNAFVSKQFVGPPAYYSIYPYVLAREGTPIAAVPAHQLSISLDHTAAITDDISLVTRIFGTYQSESLNIVTRGSQFVGLDAYSLWNASATLNWRNYTASLFVRNIFNAKGVQSIFTDAYSGGNVAANFYGSDARYAVVTPVTAGLTLSCKF